MLIVVMLDPDVAEVFHDSESVNQNSTQKNESGL